MQEQKQRMPIVAGQFYPGNREQLLKSIQDSYMHKLGSKFASGNNRKGLGNNLVAIISPHAGYVYSGPCASYSFNEIRQNRTANVYVVLGLSHHGYATSLSDQDFITPLGTIKNCHELTQSIAAECKIPIDNDAHSNEHSLEVLLPFLQAAKPGENLQIVPLIIGQENFESIRRLGSLLKSCLERHGKRTIFLVSSDFTHSGPDYGYIAEDTKKGDMKAIAMILAGKGRELYDYHKKTGITICGIYPILALLETIQFSQAKLLSYYNSSEIMDAGRGSSVSYASIAFYK